MRRGPRRREDNSRFPPPYRTVREPDLGVTGGDLDGRPSRREPPVRPPGRRRIKENATPDLEWSYEGWSSVRTGSIDYKREVRPVPGARGATVAKLGFIFGVISSVLGILFIGGFLLDSAVLNIVFVAFAGCLAGMAGSLFSIAGILLAVIGLALGAGLNRSKAIFAIIFSVLYWVMMGLYVLLVFFILASFA
ncbi:MAG: hypothetical protein ACMUHY_01295 [Thermoplasmatota archaeon]